VLYSGMKTYNRFTDVLEDKNWESRLKKHVRKSKEGRKALSLGFGSCDMFAMMYHNLGIPHIVGLEIQHAAELIQERWKGHPKEERPDQVWGTWFDVYRDTVKVFSGGSFPKMKTLEAFESAFTLHHATDMRAFLADCSEQFDFIVASNSLHHVCNPKHLMEILISMRRVLKANGIFYIRVKEFPAGERNPLPLPVYRSMMDEIFGKESFHVCQQEKSQVSFPHEGRATTFWNF
jgi:ubiquinone/menaquinone biosynthesis C-methylase UbiE